MASGRFSVPLFGLTLVGVLFVMGIVARLGSPWPAGYQAMLVGAFAGGVIETLVIPVLAGAHDPEAFVAVFIQDPFMLAVALLGGIAGACGAGTVGGLGFGSAAFVITKVKSQFVV